jgi:hypothetical protein
MTRFTLFLAAFALATAAFWLTILTDPPVSAAAPQIAPEAAEPSAPLPRARYVPEEWCGRFGDCPR